MLNHTVAIFYFNSLLTSFSEGLCDLIVVMVEEIECLMGSATVPDGTHRCHMAGDTLTLGLSRGLGFGYMFIIANSVVHCLQVYASYKYRRDLAEAARMGGVLGRSRPLKIEEAEALVVRDPSKP